MPVTASIIFFVVLPILFVIAGVWIFLYLRNLFELVKYLEHHQPELWKQLGSPRGAIMQDPAPGKFGNFYYIDPFMPLFLWILSGKFYDIDDNTLRFVNRIRIPFCLSFVAFVLLLGSFGLFIFIVESA